MSVLARLEGVERRFGSVQALAGAHLEIRAGEVHGVLGENGAGKSTLLGVLGGMLRPDAGVVEIGGEPVAFASPRDAWARGVGLVHQHFMLVPSLTVLENLALGRRGPQRGRTHQRAVVDDAERLMERTGLVVPLHATVEQLSVGHKQRVEILRTLLREPSIIALDEPTAALAPTEIGALFALLRQLAAEGAAVVLVAHKIDEVLGVADRVTVLRKGRTVLSEPRDRVDAGALVGAMVGQDRASRAPTGASRRTPPRARARGQRVATLESIVVRDASGHVSVHAASLDVHRGEIVGVAGIEGSGQRELALVLSGRRDPDAGVATIPRGVGFVPQDRTTEALIGDFDLVENVALGLHADPRVANELRIRWSDARRLATDVVTKLGVVASGVDARAAELSGGNQQRLVVGRELLVAEDLLVAENPARGLDVAATAFVHDELRRITSDESGPGVVLVSNDLDEALELSDRLFVMTRGRLLPVPEAQWTPEGVGALMLGAGGSFDPEGPGAAGAAHG
jgi:simple sugar transport system ATP-binding protein